MCGICGILHLDGAPVERQLLTQMAEVLKHRGPDDEGYFLENSLGLAFRRLSIIDLAGGRQPMTNEDGSLQLVFNGEIYNFQALRSELLSQGHTFRTAADTEVILHGYEAWGEEVVHHLNGMFAFALWDRRRRRLLLARDRLGIKPLYYTLLPGTLAFASEIKSLLLLPGVDAGVSDRGVFEYFSHHFVPGSGTIYQGIQKLQPGEILVAEEGKCRIHRYWEPVVRVSHREKSQEQWCEELWDRLREAVRLQMVADVPLGVFLSGGLDSSAVTAAMADLGVPEIRSFNIGFDVAKYDETRFASQVGRHLGTRHESHPVTATSIDILPKLLWHLDEPMADATIIPTYLLSQFTRRQVKVALSGEGGDELFLGYTHYQGMQLNRRLGLLPPWLRRLAAAMAPGLPNFGSPRLGYFWHRVGGLFQSSLYPLFQAYTRKLAFFTPEQQGQLFSEDFRSRVRGFPYLDAYWSVAKSHPELDPFTQASLSDLTVYLPGDMLVKVDRMSMACSLEVRVPMLDHTLVEFALSMPLNLKFKGMRTKHILREALASRLPKNILNRRKRGFIPPMEFWLQSHLLEYAREYRLMETLAATGYFNVGYVQQMADSHVRGQANYAKQLWALLVFAIWWRQVRGRGLEPA